jgi:hypothetical protein
LLRALISPSPISLISAGFRAALSSTSTSRIIRMGKGDERISSRPTVERALQRVNALVPQD